MQKAVAANLASQMSFVPARQETVNGAVVARAGYYTVRISGEGPLGPAVLKTLSDAGVSLASSDALVQ
jgi:hypothetical protein